MIAEQRLEEVLSRDVRVVEVVLRPGRDLAQVVRRDLRGHADRDAGRAVDEQVGEAARQHGRLHRLAVVVRDEVDGVLLDVADHLHRDRGHPALGVSRGRGAVVAAGAEVALAVDERVAQRPVLHEAHEGVVDRRVAVRVVVAHDVADDTRALVVAAVGAVAAVVHRVDDAAVHGLEAVAHVGQGAADDDRHRVLDVAALHLGVEVDRLDPVVLADVGRHDDRAGVGVALVAVVVGGIRVGAEDVLDALVGCLVDVVSVVGRQVVAHVRSLCLSVRFSAVAGRMPGGDVSRGTHRDGIRRAFRCRGTSRRGRSSG